MSNINKFECILCQNIAEYDFSCLHHLCKTCYKIENFCMICNTKNIQIKHIEQVNKDNKNEEDNEDEEYEDNHDDEDAPSSNYRGGGLMQLVLYGSVGF